MLWIYIYIYIYDLAMKTEQINNNQSNIQQSVAQTNPSNNNVTVIRHEHTFADHSQKKFILILRYTLIIGAVFAFFMGPYSIYTAIKYFNNGSLQFSKGQIAGLIIACILFMALAVSTVVLMALTLTAKYMHNMKINVAAWCVAIPFYIFVFMAFLAWIGWKIFVIKMSTKREITIKGDY
ncbi:Hypothetical protein BC85_0649 [Mycoplasmopsis bovis]|nr:Hypothetical protein BC85_0649 [Mycoplasmopsis bovis]